MDVLERAAEALEPFVALARADLPSDVTLFDVHTHVGTDIDGMTCDAGELVALHREWDVAGGFTFCLDEPDREPSFTAANDRTLSAAGSTGGHLLPFVRLDLLEGSIEEAERCLDRGACGIKLHPRAQRFSVGDARLDPVFALARERNVPVLIHGGRGLPPIADHLHRLVEANEGIRLIIAHAGIADMHGLAGHLGGLPGVYFDTSVWSPVDLLDLMRRVSPEQIVFATDYPYGRLPNMLLLALRSARLAGFDEAHVRAMLGGTGRSIAAGVPPATSLSPPVGGETLAQPLAFARIHHYISMATPLLWMREPDGAGGLGLAVNASLEPASHVAEAELIRSALVAAGEIWEALPTIEDRAVHLRAARVAGGLVQLADILAVTTRA